jgi:hypothetical protein
MVTLYHNTIQWTYYRAVAIVSLNIEGTVKFFGVVSCGVGVHNYFGCSLL